MFKPVTIGFLVLLLGACQHIEDYKEVRAPIKPVVTRADVSTNIQYDYKKCVIKKDQKAKLRQFVMAHDIDPQDELSVAYADIDPELAKKRIRTLSKALADLGLKATFYPSSQIENAQNLRLSLTRYQVHVPNCPNWSHTPGRDYNNEASPNYGCSSAALLALMIGNPKDLMEGRPLSAADAEVLSNAIATYQTPRASETASTGEE